MGLLDRERILLWPDLVIAPDDIDGTNVSSSKNFIKQANVGMAACIAYFIQRGMIVSLPIGDGHTYDLSVDDGDKIYRIEVKTSFSSRHHVTLSQHYRNGPDGSYQRRRFDKNKCDYLFLLLEDGRKFLIPSADLPSGHALHLSAKWNEYRI